MSHDIIRRRRTQLQERDGGACHTCGKVTENWEMHHIVPISDGGTYALDNLQTQCHNCHVDIHRYDPPKNLISRCPTCNSRFLQLISENPPVLFCTQCKAKHPGIDVFIRINDNGKTKWKWGVVKPLTPLEVKQ